MEYKAGCVLTVTVLLIMLYATLFDSVSQHLRVDVSWRTPKILYDPLNDTQADSNNDNSRKHLKQALSEPDLNANKDPIPPKPNSTNKKLVEIENSEENSMVGESGNVSGSN